MQLSPISLQLFSLRKDVYTAGDDLPGVLRTVADIGYQGVEIARCWEFDPKEIARMIRDLGMTVSSSHTTLPMSENIQQIVDEESALGNTHVISGFGPDDMKTADDYRRCAEKFQRAAELLKPHGMSFGFHNHWWEFAALDGQYAYDILMAEAPDAFSELDVYWAAYAKADPVKVVSQYKSRLPLLHIKDGMLKEGEFVHTAVGSGLLDIPGIIGAADPNVLKWVVVEIDACATDMLEAVRESYRYLTSLA